ncbi:hypothetical protein BESB_020540 [Besnoitia besnoiti]|uniref:Uncharacterized protein n=1 Tax=Besnoitia besnoiti TaxID=94643 RepID=A0A2A9M8U3_BESBE|nr:hypothetical protein BESB_020540 [Besnoitia besnoiti]PFH32113.1 hypothetical protein BESB_020540 [Besnoitia besnoiti]
MVRVPSNHLSRAVGMAQSGLRGRGASRALAHVPSLPGSLLLLGGLLVCCAVSAAGSLSSAAQQQRGVESLLDNLACVDSSPAVAPLSGSSWEQLRCVDAAAVSLLSSRKAVQPGNVLLMLDIDDTLIASGGWSAVMGKSLGGVDDRYARGSDYPGLGSVLFLTALGPHARHSKTGQLREFAPPTNVMVVTARPNLSLFRPEHLFTQLSSILLRGARQIMGEAAPPWRVGSENVINPVRALAGCGARGENKLAFITKVMANGQPIGDSFIDDKTKYIFVGDTAERDLEVGVGLATVASEFMLAHFVHVIHSHKDPAAKQSISSPQKLDEDLLNRAGAALQDALVGAARAAFTAGRLLKEAEADKSARHRAAPEGLLGNQSSSKQKTSFYDTLGNTSRFGIKLGNTLVDAISLTYEVTISADDEDGPRSCAQLSARQAYQVGTLVGDKIRAILDLYEHRWRQSYARFRGMDDQAPTSPPRMPPLFFVKCTGVKLRVADDVKLSSPLGEWISEIAGASANSVRVRFRGNPALAPGSELRLASLKDGELLDEVGTPVVPYVTSVSAVTQAYALGLVDLTDVVVAVRKTFEALRSQGPLARPARLASLLDHQHDLEALLALLFPGGVAALPASVPARVRAMAEFLEQVLQVQKAFIRRAAYIRASPDRMASCVREMEAAADLHYFNRVKRERANAAEKSAGPSFSRNQMLIFTRAFAEIACEYDVEIASVKLAGATELEGLSVLLSRLVRQLLSTADETVSGSEGAQKEKKQAESSSRLRASAGLVNLAEKSPRDKIDESPSTGGGAACQLSEEARATFAAMYETFCSAVAPNVCQLLKSRLFDSGVFHDLLFLAQERAARNLKPLRLPHLGRVLFADHQTPEHFQSRHQKPAESLIGAVGATLDEAMKEQAASGFLFATWPVPDSSSRWKHVAASLQMVVDCDLFAPPQQ